MSSLLAQYQEVELLRIATAGSVDDGKSTLIGRLLYDSKSIFEDQLQSIRDFSSRYRDQDIDYSLVTDGLKSEREQGITIDVAYRHFSTPKRRFIIADSPGHEQYTRNMATGASTASLSLIIIDACKGVTTQTKRHTFISSLLGIRHFLVAVNKMDLVDYSEEVFHGITGTYRDFSDKLPIESIQFIPISALLGDNVIEESARMPWYRGSPLLDYLETVNVSAGRNLIDFRFPVQYVNWGGRVNRGYCGSIVSGIIRVGEKVHVLPSGKSSTVRRIVAHTGEIQYAFAPQAVTLYLEDEIDIGRGDMIVRENNIPRISDEVEANLVWMDARPMEIGRYYLVKHTTRTTKGTFPAVKYRFDPDDLHRKKAETLHLNEIGKVRVRFVNPLFADIYETNRHNGCFIVIDPASNLTVAAGMITNCGPFGSGRPEGGKPVEGNTFWYPPAMRERAMEEYSLRKSQQIPGIFIDDEALGEGLNRDLPEPSRAGEYTRRTAHLCRLANAGGITVYVVSRYGPDADVRAILGDRLQEPGKTR